MSEATGIERRLGWYAAGQHIALDVARGLHFLHKSGVRFRPPPPATPIAPIQGCRLKPGGHSCWTTPAPPLSAASFRYAGSQQRPTSCGPLHNVSFVVHPGC